MGMIVFPNGKINIGLRVIEKRSDGYHNIESIMVPVAFCDILEIVPSSDNFTFYSSGIEIDSTCNKNLSLQAYELMKRNYPIHEVKIHLHKLIPPGSGLGGGSSDASFTLILLRRLFGLKFCNNELEDLAMMLGSDCPFFVANKPQLIEGTGIATHRFIQFPPFRVVIVLPDIAVSTAWAYNKVKPSGQRLPEPKKIINNYNEWPKLIFNDFEEPVFSEYPVLADIKEKLYENGAFYAAMSGSGSSIFGLFEEKPDNLEFLKDFEYRVTRILV